MTLSDRTCVVTGASRGIGRAIAEEFGRHGASVVNYRSSGEMANETVDRIEAAGGSAVPARADVSDGDDVRAAEHGRLIDVSSVVGQQGNYGQANYATTKSGLFGFTRTLALEMAASGSTANCVAPGFVETDMLETVPERVKEKILRRIPLNRFATPEDVAGIVRFVASEDAGYMTGQILAVNGGMDWQGRPPSPNA
jgi:3-oxoacyl-[acyl-carrier protein] reductase